MNDDRTKLPLYVIFSFIGLSIFLGFTFNKPINDVLLIPGENFRSLQILISLIVTSVLIFILYKFVDNEEGIGTRAMIFTAIVGIFFAFMIGGPLAYLNSTSINQKDTVNGKIIEISTTKSQKGTIYYKMLLEIKQSSMLDSGQIEGLNFKQQQKWQSFVGKDVKISLSKGLLNAYVIDEIKLNTSAE